ncbi:MAG: tyrosine-type recombinase/integrase [Erythrobacter sp.]|nr:tyrosine-type recombinase/integrase [Erythrobacter sp.]MDZ4273394.1 tyrosine-type recombinase/integrase [Erythrobacter sp.]
MTYSHLDPAMQNRVSWNAGRTVGTKRPLTQKQIWAIRFFLDREERLRDRAMIIQRKTGRPVQFEITADARTSLATWLLRRGGTIDDFVFPSRIHSGQPMSTRQYARLVDEWVTAVGLRREDYGTHSMRRTKAAMIYRTTGNLRAVQILLGHSKIENTVRYLGVDVEDALVLAERIEI